MNRKMLRPVIFSTLLLVEACDLPCLPGRCVVAEPISTRTAVGGLYETLRDDARALCVGTIDSEFVGKIRAGQRHAMTDEFMSLDLPLAEIRLPVGEVDPFTVLEIFTISGEVQIYYVMGEAITAINTDGVSEQCLRTDQLKIARCEGASCVNAPTLQITRNGE